MKIIPYRIRRPDLEMVEIMRRIYNAVRADLSDPPPEPRTYDQQTAWWKSRDHEKTQAFLYNPENEPFNMIGFSLLQQKHPDFKTPQIGLWPEDQGKGYGRQIVNHYLETADGPLAGSDLFRSPAIAHINDSVGWKQVGSKDGSRLLYHPGPYMDPRQDEIYRDILRYHGLEDK